jgi:hypothetical protein
MMTHRIEKMKPLRHVEKKNPAAEAESIMRYVV